MSAREHEASATGATGTGAATAPGKKAPAGAAATGGAPAVGKPIRAGLEALASAGDYMVFAGRTFAGIPRAIKHHPKDIFRQVIDISFGTASVASGGGTLTIVAAMSVIAAMMVGVESYRGLDLIGLSSLSGVLSGVVNTRELAPVIAGIAIAAKVGTGFTARLGSMRISDEIDALESMGIPPIPYLASTRTVAALICVVPLYLIGLLCSYVTTRLVVVWFNNGSAGTYDHYFQLTVTVGDVFYSLLKVIIFALLVVMIHCAYGYFASGGPEGVGRAAGRALRTTILAIGFADLILTFTFWGLIPRVPGLGLT